jgi:hypothetical protein
MLTLIVEGQSCCHQDVYQEDLHRKGCPGEGCPGEGCPGEGCSGEGCPEESYSDRCREAQGQRRSTSQGCCASACRRTGGASCARQDQVWSYHQDHRSRRSQDYEEGPRKECYCDKEGPGSEEGGYHTQEVNAKEDTEEVTVLIGLLSIFPFLSHVNLCTQALRIIPTRAYGWRVL